jgi:hypothetical protein
MDLSFDADAVRALGRDTGRLAENLLVEAKGAEASLTEASSSTGQEDVQVAVDELLQTLRTAHAGVIQGLMGFGAELEAAADAVEQTDQKLAAKVPTA